MATKANAARKAQVVFVVSGSTTTAVFSAVRNWSVRVERKVIDATNNDSLAWRELVLPSSTTVAGAVNAGQMGGTLTAEAVYDLSPTGPAGGFGRSQTYERNQIMRHLVDGNNITSLQLRLGADPGSTSGFPSAGAWATIASQLSKGGFVESVEVGGSYDDPVLYDVTFRYNGRITG